MDKVQIHTNLKKGDFNMSSLTLGNLNPTFHHSTPNEIGPSINEVLPLDMIREVLGNLQILLDR